MGFFNQLFSNIVNSVKTISNPSKMMALKEDLVTPRDVSMGGLFRKLDTTLDIASPIHNIVQEGTTGSKTTEGQSPYFNAIAPTIVNAFFPGAGSMAAGLLDMNDGQTEKGAKRFISGYFGQLGSYGTDTTVGQVGKIGQAGMATATLVSNSGQAVGGISSKTMNALETVSLFTPSGDLFMQLNSDPNFRADQQKAPVYSGGAGGGTMESFNKEAAAQIIAAQESATKTKSVWMLAALGAGIYLIGRA